MFSKSADCRPFWSVTMSVAVGYSVRGWRACSPEHTSFWIFQIGQLLRKLWPFLWNRHDLSLQNWSNGLLWSESILHYQFGLGRVSEEPYCQWASYYNHIKWVVRNLGNTRGQSSRPLTWTYLQQHDKIKFRRSIKDMLCQNCYVLSCPKYLKWFSCPFLTFLAYSTLDTACKICNPG